jgi:Family of unknown function (DUF6229)
MNNTSDAAELVAQWRNHENQNNPAGPLFAAGEFAEADIVNATAEFVTRCSSCTGSSPVFCC